MTTELIKTTGITLNGDKITAVNARDLWKFLESKQDFSTWIKRRIEKYEFIEGQDYLLHKFVEQLPSGAKHCIEYLITLDMAKELAMVENNERGRQARQYFIEVERQFRDTGNLLEKAVAAMLPVIRENERLKMQYEYARHFLPEGEIGELNKNGVPKTRYRRGFFCAGNGKSAGRLFLEHPSLPGLFEEQKATAIAVKHD